CRARLGANRVLGHPRFLRRPDGRLRVCLAPRRHQLGPRLRAPQGTAGGTRKTAGTKSKCLIKPQDERSDSWGLGDTNMGWLEGRFEENVMVTTLEQGIAWAR